MCVAVELDLGSEVSGRRAQLKVGHHERRREVLPGRPGGGEWTQTLRQPLCGQFYSEPMDRLRPWHTYSRVERQDKKNL